MPRGSELSSVEVLAMALSEGLELLVFTFTALLLPFRFRLTVRATSREEDVAIASRESAVRRVEGVFFQVLVAVPSVLRHGFQTKQKCRSSSRGAFPRFSQSKRSHPRREHCVFWVTAGQFLRFRTAWEAELPLRSTQ